MPSPSAEIIQLLNTFALAMSVRTFAKSLVLIYGAILAPGARTVSAALRVMGLGELETFVSYHRVLNRDQWSPWLMSQLLLSLLIRLFVPEGAALVLLIDETLERRWGRQIKYRGRFYDAVRSKAGQIVTSLGIRWCCIALLVTVPWSRRPWALPFILVPTLAPKVSAKLHKSHRTSVGWAVYLINKVRRWQPERDIVLVGDAAYAAVDLVAGCQQRPRPVRFVSRLRLDAALYDPAGPQPKSKRGPKPKKGARQPSLQSRLTAPATEWKPVELPGYGGERKPLELATGTALWHHRGKAPVPVRWVLVRCPEQSFKPCAFFCSDLTVSAEQIVHWYIGRWNIEVTFEEMRAQLGFETQRQWSERAIERTAPCLFGLFSLIVAMARILYPTDLPLLCTSWYQKTDATFSDALAAVRQHLWQQMNYRTSSAAADLCLIPKALLQALTAAACHAT